MDDAARLRLRHVVDYRPPTAAPTTPWHKPSLAGVTEVIRTAAADQSLLADRARILGVPPERLKTACLRYLTDTLFAADASSYRTLGLEPGADAEQIKLHYRLLVKLFHPDRSGLDETAQIVYTSRLNKAYADVKKRPVAAPGRLPGAAAGGGRAPPPNTPPRPARGKFLVRRLAIGIGFIAPLWFLLTLLSGGDEPGLTLSHGDLTTPSAAEAAATPLPAKPPQRAVNGGDRGAAPAQAADTDSAATRRADALYRQLRLRGATASGDAEPASAAAERPQNPSRATAAASPPALRVTGPEPTLPAPLATTPLLAATAAAAKTIETNETARTVKTAATATTAESAVPAKTASITKTAATTKTAAITKSAESAAPAKTAAITSATDAAAPIAQTPADRSLDYELTLQRFGYAFETGKLRQISALLSKRARGNSWPGKSPVDAERLRWEYQWILLSTSSRKLSFSGVRWSTAPAGVRGSGRYSLQVRDAEGVPQTLRGRVNLDLVVENGALRIERFILN